MSNCSAAGVASSQAEEANGKARQGSGKAGRGRSGPCYSPARLHNAVAKVAPHLKVWLCRAPELFCMCLRPDLCCQAAV
jgi:hypothetical protein